MLDYWQLSQGAAWRALLGMGGAVLAIGRHLTQRSGRTSFGEFDVRHEIVDECFAKGEMTRADCEQGCATVGADHARCGSSNAACHL